MSLPVGVGAYAANFTRGTALIGVARVLYFYKARVLALQDEPADYVGAHIDDRGKLGGRFLGVFYLLRVGKNGLYPVARGQNPAPAIENHASLRLAAPECPLLCERSVEVMLGHDGLEIEASRAKRQE